jgi:DNA-binding CsgD family transcriptional regulator
VEGAQLIGRDDELAEIRAFLEDSRPLPRVLLLEGEAGIGKTSLWRASLDIADQASFRVLSAQTASSEGELAFALVNDLLEHDVNDLLPELPRPQRRALEIALLLEDPDSAAPDQRTIATAFLGTLRLLARKRRLVLAIDDVQWIDAASRRALEFALRRLSEEPIAFLLTRRAEPDGPPPLGLGRAMAADAFTRLHIGPLSLGALSELLRIRLGFTCPRPTIRRLADESGGNPFLALEFARALQRRGARIEPGEPLPVPTTLHELVADRLAALPAHTHEALLVVALAFEPTVELVARALDGGAWKRILPALDADAIHVEGSSIGFTHPLVAAAVQASVGAHLRRHTHRLLADVVAAPEERAWHLALASEVPDAEIARNLEQAGEAAAARGAPSTAAGLLEHSWRLTPPGAGEANERCVAAARFHFRAGDARRAEELLQQALHEASPGVARARVLHELADVEQDTRGVRQGTDRYYAALREAEDAPALQASIHRELASILRFTRDVETAREHAEAAVALAREAGDRRSLADALAFAALLQFNAGEPGSLALAEHAVALVDGVLTPTYRAGHVLAHHLVWSGRFADARPGLEELQRELSARGDVSVMDVLWYLAHVELRAGNWGQASEHTEALHALVLQSGREAEEWIALWPKALVAAHLGDLDASAAMSERGLALAEASGARMGVVIHQGVLGFVELSRGKPRQACTHLAAAHDTFATLGIREPGMTFVISGLPDAIEALATVGAQAQAQALLEPWEKRARSLDRPWPLSVALRCRGLVLAAQNDLASALGAVEESLAEHERAEDPFQLARTQLAAGALQRRAKQRRAARESLEGAQRLFAELGAPTWTDRASVELGRIGGRRPSSGALTVTERRLAELVAEGRSNKEIAAALFVTPKTVGTMLSRIYAKRGVHSRTELAHVLAERRASKV